MSEENLICCGGTPSGLTFRMYESYPSAEVMVYFKKDGWTTGKNFNNYSEAMGFIRDDFEMSSLFHSIKA